MDYASLNCSSIDFVPDGANGALRGAGTASSANNNPAVYWFVQDDWKVLPRLPSILDCGMNGPEARDEGKQALTRLR